MTRSDERQALLASLRDGQPDEDRTLGDAIRENLALLRDPNSPAPVQRAALYFLESQGVDPETAPEGGG